MLWVFSKRITVKVIDCFFSSPFLTSWSNLGDTLTIRRASLGPDVSHSAGKSHIHCWLPSSTPSRRSRRRSGCTHGTGTPLRASPLCWALRYASKADWGVWALQRWTFCLVGFKEFRRVKKYTGIAEAFGITLQWWFEQKIKFILHGLWS